MTRKFLLAALVILLAALCTVHLTAERTPPENVVSPAVHLGMVVPREALEKLKAAETAALAAPQTAEPTADVTAEPAEEESLPATDTSVLAAAVTTDALYIRRSGDWDAEALALVDYGTTVAVTGKSGGWYQVRYDGIEGYLSGEYLDLRTSGLTGYGQVTADALNLRSGAGTGYETVTSLPNGAWVLCRLRRGERLRLRGLSGAVCLTAPSRGKYVLRYWFLRRLRRPTQRRRRRNGLRIGVGSGGAGPVLSGGALRLWRGVSQRF